MHSYKIFTLFLVILLSACVTTSNKPASEKRRTILEMRGDVLSDLYKLQPLTRQEIQSAPGYAVFSNANVKFIIASVGGGYGVVTNNITGENTYMNMGELGVGLGLGATDLRLVFVFHDQKAMDSFINKGWVFGVKADAAAKLSDKGAADSEEGLVNKISVYQITENGLSLAAVVKGTKFWKSKELN
jgi:lipid-binding SYLF domain-containing protein